MKIAYIIPGCAVSGGIAVICQHANRLKRRGHDVVLLSLAPPAPMTWFPNQGVPVYDIADWSGELDILVATGWSTSFWLTRVSAKVKCYFVQSDETRFHPEGSRWQHMTTLTYYLGVNYLTEAKWIRAWLYDNFGHTAELVPNGLDSTIFFPSEPLLPKGQKPRVLLEGAIDLPYKGMAEAFEAVMPLDVEIWCVSSFGSPKKNWRCDKFFEQIPMMDMRKVYSSCDILLKLSKVEGFFGPPMEMMACGGVSVVGKVTGYDEYIVDGVNALVVESGDIAAATAAVKKLIDQPELRSSLVAAGKKTAVEWNWDRSIDILERYYQSLLSDPTKWCVHGKRAQYDRSISYAYDVMCRSVEPGHATNEGAGREAPAHAYRLAAYLASNRLFWIFSAFVRHCYWFAIRSRSLFLRVTQRGSLR